MYRYSRSFPFCHGGVFLSSRPQIFPQALGSSQKLLMNFKALKDTLGQAADSSADEPREDLLYQSM
jgi:hypothetical protein